MSRALAPSRRPRRVLQLVLVLACLVLVGACTHQRQVPDKYGDTTRDNFTEGCIEALTQRGPDPDGIGEDDLGGSEPLSSEEAREVCTCSYEGISDPEGGISYERFQEITEQQEDEPGPLPEEITSIVAGCRQEHAPV